MPDERWRRQRADVLTLCQVHSVFYVRASPTARLCEVTTARTTRQLKKRRAHCVRDIIHNYTKAPRRAPSLTPGNDSVVPIHGRDTRATRECSGFCYSLPLCAFTLISLFSLPPKYRRPPPGSASPNSRWHENLAGETPAARQSLEATEESLLQSPLCPHRAESRPMSFMVR